jgi:gliding motility-associated-like protein
MKNFSWQKYALLNFILISTAAFGQNICPNPGFEQISACPTLSGEINLCNSWSGAGIAADLFNFCHVNGAVAGCNDVSIPVNFAGYSTAHGGSSYAGFYTKQLGANQRTYLQAPITPMVPNQIYKISAFIKRASSSKYATNNVGFSFSTAALSQVGGSFIPVTPQLVISNVIADTSNWTSFNTYYSAVGGEAFITIGNFKSDAATSVYNFSPPVAACSQMHSSAFYYIDDISIIAISETLSITGDSSICLNESTQLTGNTNTTGWWSLAVTPNDTITAVNNTISVSPPITTTYLFHGMQSSQTVTVVVGAPPTVVLPPDSTACKGTTVVLDAGNAGSSFLWSSGAVTQSITATDSTTYIVTVSNSYCSVTDTFKLHLLPIPDINLPNSATICPNNNEFIILNAGQGTSYLWTPGNDTTQYITATAEGSYMVTVNQQNGCTNSGSTIVKEVCNETLFFPAAFTPNNDGKNETFYGDGTSLIDYNLKIFNRWGQLVYETSIPGSSGGWNGKYNNVAAQSGTYTFIATFSAEKTSGKKKFFIKKGSFVLIR